MIDPISFVLGAVSASAFIGFLAYCRNANGQLTRNVPVPNVGR